MLLYVGSLFVRRHVPEMLDAFTRMAARRTDVTLVIVGEDRNTPPLDLAARLRHSPAAARVSLKPYVSDGELSDLYARAAAFVFLSEYEGFGMTPLDAMAAGLPIVVLDTEVAREIYGPAAIYVASPDPVLVEAALERALFDAEERARLIDAGRTMLERYSWRECAQRTLQTLLSVAST
jgi:alpha-1,3-rhamnosyl/mannosyltransferase